MSGVEKGKSPSSNEELKWRVAGFETLAKKFSRDVAETRYLIAGSAAAIGFVLANRNILVFGSLWRGWLLVPIILFGLAFVYAASSYISYFRYEKKMLEHFHDLWR